jgi:hypothetical protein
MGALQLWQVFFKNPNTYLQVLQDKRTGARCTAHLYASLELPLLDQIEAPEPPVPVYAYGIWTNSVSIGLIQVLDRANIHFACPRVEVRQGNAHDNAVN